jgi:hypothetical protein
MDLIGGRHPDFNEEWLLDGSPSIGTPMWRRTCERRQVAGTVTIAPQTLTVIALPVQIGDQFSLAAMGVKTATGTPTHSWVAVYNGITAGAAMLAQSADAPGGFTAGALQLAITAITTSIQQYGTVGTPQSGGAIIPSAAAVWGVAIYNSGAAGAVLDSTAAGGNVNGEVIHTGQIPLVQTAALAATATAPAVLPALTAVTSAIPYVLLSRY